MSKSTIRVAIGTREAAVKTPEQLAQLEQIVAMAMNCEVELDIVPERTWFGHSWPERCDRLKPAVVVLSNLDDYSTAVYLEKGIKLVLHVHRTVREPGAIYSAFDHYELVEHWGAVTRRSDGQECRRSRTTGGFDSKPHDGI